MNGPGGPRMPYEHERVPKPKNFRDLPRYMKEVLGGFFLRFGYVVKLVWQTGKWILFLLSFIALFQGVSPLIGSLLSKGIINELQVLVKNGGLQDSAFWGSWVFYLLIFLFIYRIINRIILVFSQAVNRIAGEKVTKTVKLRIMEKSKELDLKSFDDPEFYEKMENANREAGMRPLTVLQATFNAISTFIELISFLLVLITAPGLGWMTLVIAAVSIPSGVINFIYRRKNFAYMRHRSKERRQMNYYAETMVDKDRIKEVRMFDLGDTLIGKYLEVFAKYYKGLRRLILSESIWYAAVGIVAALVNLVFYALIAKQVFTGTILLGDYTLYTGAIASIANAITSLINSSGTIYEGTLFIDNLIAFMKEKRTVAPSVSPAVTVPRTSRHEIRFENVFFRYPGSDHDVIKNVNLVIHPGETLALVGLNGAGKTTLIKLLTRLYDPTGGAIYLDGKNIKEYDLESLYAIFGIIFQDFGKYAFTVEENIRFGDIHKKAEESAVREAARQSAAAEFIERLPNGYATPLMRYFETTGTELSIGQWQKIAVARAFYADSDVMILDEPTASLDAIAEQEIFSQFDRLRGNKTTIFVSHRLSSATTADRVVVLKGGEIAEIGTHAELMAEKGEYYRLFSTQAKHYIESEKASK